MSVLHIRPIKIMPKKHEINPFVAGTLLYTFSKNKPVLWCRTRSFPIVQGSVYEDLREQSACFAKQFDCPGYAIGGLSVGEPAETMYKITEQVCDILPLNKPRYLMGVGTPANIIRCIGYGIDMFDCVMPTRNGRNAMIFTRNGIMNMRNKNGSRIFLLLKKTAHCKLIKQHQSHICVIYLLPEKCLDPFWQVFIILLFIYVWLAKHGKQ